MKDVGELFGHVHQQSVNSHSEGFAGCRLRAVERCPGPEWFLRENPLGQLSPLFPPCISLPGNPERRHLQFHSIPSGLVKPRRASCEADACLITFDPMIRHLQGQMLTPDVSISSIISNKRIRYDLPS